MSSMSYCRFENTLSDLGACVEAMEKAKTIADLEMNEHERAAFNVMWRYCRDYLAEHERLLMTDLDTNIQ